MVASEVWFQQTTQYTQATEPTDKTEGKRWYNTSSGKWYTSDGTNYILDSVDLSHLEQQNLEQNLNILINSASASALNDYEDMFLDIFSDADGYDGTVNTGNTTARFDSASYDNLEVIYGTTTDATEYSKVSAGFGLVKTFSNVNAQVEKVVQNTRTTSIDVNANTRCRYIYADATPDANVDISIGSTGYVSKTFNNPNPLVEVATIEMYLSARSGTYTSYCKDNVVTWSTESYTDLVIETNAQSIDADPVGHQVFCHSSVAGSGSVTYDISFDGGSTWITGQAVNTKNTSVHVGSSMVVKLNLEGVGAGNTAEVSDYAVMLDY